MKTITVEPNGWECLIEECPPGHFMYEGQLCFKTEYGNDLDEKCPMEVYNSAGETFMPRKIMVQPVSIMTTVEEE